MKYCGHSHWLGLHTGDSKITFTHSDRAQTLVQELPSCESQKPSLFVLIGNTGKSLALRELISGPTRAKSTAKRGHGEIHLHINSSTVFGDRPVLFADGDIPLHQKPSKALSTEKCHEVTSRILPRLRDTIPTPSLQKAADNVYFRLLSPFTDVFCFFAADLGGLQPIARRIATWLDLGQPSTLPPETHPQIVIVVESSAPELQESHILDRFLRLLNEETQREISTQFAGVRILSLLSDGDVSAQARHRKLKECLMNTSDQVRLARLESRTLFSALHFAAFLNHACSHLAESVTQPFDFIRTSRLDNQPAPDLREHLINLLTKIKTPQELTEFAIPLIASSFLLDSYPPDMHRFSPSDTFRVLYKDDCHQACRGGVLAHEGSEYLVLPSGFSKMVENTFSELFDDLNRHTTNTAVDLHRQLLLKFSSDRLSYRSDDTCLVCIRRRPQYRLPCGHCICENCVRAFGRKSEHDPWLFEVDSCFFCGLTTSVEVDSRFFCGLTTSGVVVKTLPQTAGIRVLTLDGGGVRGIAHLEYLQALQDTVGLPYHVQENFDVIFGTSIGGIIGLILSVYGWSVGEFLERFEGFATSSFQPRPSLKIPIFGPVFDFLYSYFADGRYSADNLETVLQETLGRDRSILDCSRATATGTRFGFPVTTIDDTATCVFTNYNGVGTRPRRCGYHILRPKAGLGRVPLWEIARCGSAAPSYFKPKHISGLGTFQDGGLRHNDPGNLALQEVAAMYPLANEPSLVVSLGTGSRRADDMPRMSHSRGILRDGFIPRLFRAFMLSMSSTDGHKFRSRRRVGCKEQYFRFDIEFQGAEPGLADTTKMQELKAAARAAIYGSKELDRLARCVVAELFIFELESEPWKENGHYICVGHILCRLRANGTALKALLDQLIKGSAKFFIQSQGYPISGMIQDGSCLDRAGNFRLRVAFEIPNRKNDIFIRLQEESSEPYSISGSPFTIDRLVAALQLDACFGRADHVKRKRVDSTDIQSSKRRRL